MVIRGGSVCECRWVRNPDRAGPVGTVEAWQKVTKVKLGLW